MVSSNAPPSSSKRAWRSARRAATSTAGRGRTTIWAGPRTAWVISTARATSIAEGSSGDRDRAGRRPALGAVRPGRSGSRGRRDSHGSSSVRPDEGVGIASRCSQRRASGCRAANLRQARGRARAGAPRGRARRWGCAVARGCDQARTRKGRSDLVELTADAESVGVLRGFDSRRLHSFAHTHDSSRRRCEPSGGQRAMLRR